jgi:hypothetical protein
MFSSGNIAAGSMLKMAVSGIPSTSPELITTETDSKLGLVIGLAAFGVALIGAGFYLWNRNRKTEAMDFDEVDVEAQAASRETPEELMDAIIALDDRYQAGELPEAAYQQRRAELKQRLQAVMKAK